MSIDLKSRQILATAFAPGRVHNLALFQAHLHDVSVAISYLFDKGYQGIQHQHAHAHLPFKAKPGQYLAS